MDLLSSMMKLHPYMRRLITLLLPALLPFASMAQCNFNYQFYQTGNCYLVGFDIGLIVSGGTAPYTITWYAQGMPIGTGEIISVQTTMNSPLVTVEVTDGSGCTENTAEYWIDPGSFVTADVSSQPDPLDCSNNVLTLDNVNSVGGCGNVIVALGSPSNEIGSYSQSPIVLSGFPSGTSTLFLIPNGQCGLCPTLLTVNVPNTCGANTISGRVYVDSDNSCTFNNGDGPAPGVFVRADGPQVQSVATNTAGSYTAHLIDGQYALDLPGLGPIWNISCMPSGAQNVTVPPNANAMDFGLTPVGTFNDLAVSITGQGQHRGGINTQLMVTCHNSGNTTIGGTLNLTFDPVLSYIVSIPAETGLSGSSVSWSVPPIAPFASMTYHVTLHVPRSATLGDTLTYTANIFTTPADDASANNSDQVDRIIVGSFDPNDKQVLPAGDLPILEAQSGRTLDYIVRFQNTGNAEALNVRIEDEIDPLLDLSTLEVVDASHAWSAVVTERSAVFRFDGINLPDSGSDFAASQGFIRYRLAPVPDVGVNDLITNEANIFFDYNLPVITNTVSTTVVDVSTGIRTVTDNSLDLLYDADGLTLRSTSAIERVDIFDATGHLVNTVSGKGQRRLRLAMNGLSNGVYLLKVQRPQDLRMVRVVH